MSDFLNSILSNIPGAKPAEQQQGETPPAATQPPAGESGKDAYDYSPAFKQLYGEKKKA
jgi:hypothetical protein